MGTRWSSRSVVTIILLAVAALAACQVARALAAQVYFEPTARALAAARAGRHDERIWGAVLAVSSFAAAVVTERVVLLVSVLVGIGAVMSSV